MFNPFDYNECPLATCLRSLAPWYAAATYLISSWSLGNPNYQESYPAPKWAERAAIAACDIARVHNWRPTAAQLYCYLYPKKVSNARKPTRSVR